MAPDSNWLSIGGGNSTPSLLRVTVVGTPAQLARENKKSPQSYSSTGANPFDNYGTIKKIYNASRA